MIEPWDSESEPELGRRAHLALLHARIGRHEYLSARLATHLESLGLITLTPRHKVAGDHRAWLSTASVTVAGRLYLKEHPLRPKEAH
jgi:hypothetical protein